MNDRQGGKPAQAGGIFIALLALIGVFAGGFMGQPTIGLLIGLALGIAIALGLWWKERER
ncbi:MAG: hypothetical protein EP321_07600 [Sphingomonadales bacterium]|nr:MAG: hypothetical protein EP345_13555 [Sphingomonadales bacterium]TNF04330.1 MAG: hypothetical protein EP321_07600 [Sphingomonadales bacterium]